MARSYFDKAIARRFIDAAKLCSTLTLLASAIGCATGPITQVTPASRNFLSDGTCTALPQTGVDVSHRGDADRAFLISCGASSTPSGWVYRLTPEAGAALEERGDDDFWPKATENTADNQFSWWVNAVQKDAACNSTAAVQSIAYASVESAIKQCNPRYEADGEPYFVAYSKGERGVYLSRGYGFAERTSRRLIASLEGAGDDAELNDASFPNTNAGAVQRASSFITYMKAAYAFDAARDHGSAAQHFRLALQVQRQNTDEGGLYAPRMFDAMIGLGLQLAYLDENVEAETYLRLAHHLMTEGPNADPDAFRVPERREGASRCADSKALQTAIKRSAEALIEDGELPDGLVRLAVALSAACAVWGDIDAGRVFVKAALDIDAANPALEWNAVEAARAFRPSLAREAGPALFAPPASGAAQKAVIDALAAALAVTGEDAKNALQKAQEVVERASAPPEVANGVARVGIRVITRFESDPEETEQAFADYIARVSREGGQFGARATALAELDFAGYLTRFGNTDRALSFYRKALRTLSKDRGFISIDLIAPYLDILIARRRKGPQPIDADAEEVFDLFQLVHENASFGAARYAHLRFVQPSPSADADDNRLRHSGLIQDLMTVETNLLGLRQHYSEALTASPRDDIRLREIENNLDKAQRAFRKARAALDATEHPLGEERVRLSQILAEPVRFGDVADVFGPTEALVQFIPAQDATYAFACSGKTGLAQIEKLAVSAAEIDEAVSSIRNSVTITSRGAVRPFAAKQAHLLYVSLIAPFVSTGILDVNVATHVSKGRLAEIPLDLLITDQASMLQAQRGKFDSVNWLLNGPAVFAAAPSVASVVDVKRHSDIARKALYLGLGGYKNRETSVSELLASSYCSPEKSGAFADAAKQDLIELTKLSPLRSSSRDLTHTTEMMRAYGDAQRISDIDFTQAGVIDALQTADHKIVHFSTHALAPGRSACQPLSSIVVNAPGDESAPSDRLLTTSEIMRLGPIKADLIVLSACNTARGQDRNRDAAFAGLVRSFFFTGARTVAATHWEVEVTSTTQITDLFLANMANTDEPYVAAEAMAAAKRAYLNSRQNLHPAYWAPYVVVGDGQYKVQWNDL